MVQYTLEQRVFLYDTYVEYGSARKCWQIFQCKFHDEKSFQQTNKSQFGGGGKKNLEQQDS
jgi:hypothetical protein